MTTQTTSEIQTRVLSAVLSHRKHGEPMPEARVIEVAIEVTRSAFEADLPAGTPGVVYVSSPPVLRRYELPAQ